MIEQEDDSDQLVEHFKKLVLRMVDGPRRLEEHDIAFISQNLNQAKENLDNIKRLIVDNDL
jgi:5-bromo-4-chloroindolyl phosphate hydrolysis protein